MKGERPAGPPGRGCEADAVQDAAQAHKVERLWPFIPRGWVIVDRLLEALKGNADADADRGLPGENQARNSKIPEAPGALRPWPPFSSEAP